MKLIIGMVALGRIICSTIPILNIQDSSRIQPQISSDFQVYSNPDFPNYSLRIKSDVKLCDPNYSGYLDFKDDDRHFYFWFFESRSKPETDPVVLWLNGGPGCSSFTGLLMELGPCRVDKGAGSTTINPHSWNSNANTFFLDQPVGVGFSYSDKKKVFTTDQAADDVYAFLRVFFHAFPKYSKLDFHVTGESYAGHYIPAIGRAIQNGNHKELKENNDNGLINLKSLAIGNGMTDPLIQYGHYADMAEDTKYGPILKKHDIKKMRKAYPFCKTLIDACYHFQSNYTCVPASEFCSDAMETAFSKTFLNSYDIRLEPNSTKFTDMSADLEAWLAKKEVKSALGVEKTHIHCSDPVGVDFATQGDEARPLVHAIAPLLEDGVKVLIYAGDADWICNWIGNKAWTLALDWTGKEGFNKELDRKWISAATGKPAGEYRSYGNLGFLRVYESSHFVPLDQVNY
ncbi:hypothetical protein HDV02_000129 [Globomyces sp. JEL0801]|nr:hypothetical protein HDV02_000129 [Globomyces sp. JEL0801]